MTKAEMLDAIAKNHDGLTKKQVTAIVDGVFDMMTVSIKKEGEFAYPGFGSFRVRKRKARTGRMAAACKITAAVRGRHP